MRDILITWFIGLCHFIFFSTISIVGVIVAYEVDHNIDWHWVAGIVLLVAFIFGPFEIGKIVRNER